VAPPPAPFWPPDAIAPPELLAPPPRFDPPVPIRPPELSGLEPPAPFWPPKLPPLAGAVEPPPDGPEPEQPDKTTDMETVATRRVNREPLAGLTMQHLSGNAPGYCP